MGDGLWKLEVILGSSDDIPKRYPSYTDATSRSARQVIKHKER
jgi:hypothetical protein